MTIAPYVSLAARCWARSRAPFNEGVRMLGLALIAATDTNDNLRRMHMGQMRKLFSRAVRRRMDAMAEHSYVGSRAIIKPQLALPAPRLPYLGADDYEMRNGPATVVPPPYEPSRWFGQPGSAKSHTEFTRSVDAEPRVLVTEGRVEWCFDVRDEERA